MKNNTGQAINIEAQELLAEITKRLFGKNGRQWLVDLKKFLRSKNSFISSKLLESITTIELPARVKFVAKDEFRRNRTDIKFWLSDLFEERFLGKVERNILDTTVYLSKLLRSSRDFTNEDENRSIIVELGGHEETTLYHLFSLLMKQPNGEEGTLITSSLTSGYSNIFCIRDKDNILWMVHADRYCGEWDLGVYPVKGSHDWNFGDLIVFCKAT